MDQVNRKELFDAFIECEKAKQVKDNKPMFMSIPEEWLDAGKWCCQNGHVNGMYLKSEMQGSVCLCCGSPVRLFPTGVKVEDFEKWLKV